MLVDDKPLVQTEGRPWPKGGWVGWLGWACLFLIALYALFFAYRAAVALLYPYPLEYGEGSVLNEAGQLLAGGFNPARLYPTNDTAPWLATNYSPLYYYLNAALLTLVGPNSFLEGRLLSVLAVAWLVWLLYWLCRGEGMGRRVAFGAALTPLATAPVYDWAVLAKPDILGLAFSLSGAAVAWHARKQPARWQLWVGAGLLCLLGLLTKQSYVAAPLAIGLWLTLRRQWRASGIFLASLVLPGGLVVLGLQWATGGAFLRHIPVLDDLILTPTSEDWRRGEETRLALRDLAGGDGPTLAQDCGW